MYAIVISELCCIKQEKPIHMHTPKSVLKTLNAVLSQDLPFLLLANLLTSVKNQMLLQKYDKCEFSFHHHFICHFVVYILQKDKIELMEARSPQETNRLLVKGTPH